MAKVHPTAIVSPESQLADDVSIGPFCVLTGAVKLGAGVQLISHVLLNGPIEIGDGTTIYPNAALGFPGQDFKFKIGMPTAGVKIGKGCLIREHATVHAATKPDAPTRLGDRVFMMVNAHVGHDATIHDDVILVNNTACAGHSEVQTKAIMSGNAVLHQFNRIGKFAMMSGGSAFSTDVPPFCIAFGRNMLGGVNIVGMRRNGYSAADINAVRRIFKDYLRTPGSREETLAALREGGKTSQPLLDIAAFIETAKRPIASGIRTREGSED